MELAFPTLWRTLALPNLPEPLAEHRFHPTRRWRFDFAWPDYHVAVEFDGGQHSPGGGRHNSDRDREKLNAARSLGWQVLQFSNTQWADDPTSCIELITACLLQNQPPDYQTEIANLPPHERERLYRGT